MATIPENPAPLFPLPIFIPENWASVSSNDNTSTPIIIDTGTKIIGEIIAYQGTTLPSTDWLWCDGTSYLSNLYSNLFNIIGYTYGQTAVANPASSSTSSGNDLDINPIVSVTKLDTSNTINSVGTQFWTIVIPSELQGGYFTLNTPLEIYGGANFLPFGSATLTGTTTINSVFYDVYKDAVFHQTITATPTSTTNPVVFTQSGNNATSISLFDTYYGNYTADFTPDLQTTSATYTFFVRCNYTLSSSVSGASTSYTITLQPLCNTTLNNRTGSIVSGVGSFAWTSTLNTPYNAVSVVWVGNPLFQVPNLCGKTPVGADSISTLTTTYSGTPVSSGGNRNMFLNQLATHTHSVTISPSGVPMLVSFSQNNAIQGIAAGSGDIVKTAKYEAYGYVASASFVGNSADLLPPFSVSNFIIRAN